MEFISLILYISWNSKHGSLYCVYILLVQDTATAAQPEADRPKKRVVYTSKKKKPTAIQQDTEPASGSFIHSLLMTVSFYVLQTLLSSAAFFRSA